jgi:pSer/pThr/pTyr-binding forkhead associated (FHA) protein
MQEVKIKCPNCGSMLSVKNPGNTPEATVTCPNCSAGLRVKFKQQPEEETPPRRPMGDGGETVIGQSNVSKARFFLKVAGQTYQLADGVNTIGRQASSSGASIQIATTDHKMSRHHAEIEVLRYPGGITRVKVNNWQNKNRTWVNGVELKDDETLILKNGCRLKMGDTEMFFVAENDD